MNSPYIILEVANCHGGNKDYMLSLIDEFASFTGSYGMKFQPFKYDKIACADYAWYDVYKELFFTEEEWAFFISKAGESKDIWLDLFDEYSVLILEKNLPAVKGIKLQASVLNNVFLIEKLRQVDLSQIKVAVNISGFEIPAIKEKLTELSQELAPLEILIEIGFQAYPTEVGDSGFSKMETLKKHFTNQLVFADHVDGKAPDAIWMPVVAAYEGVAVIEKHIMHSERETKYDHASAINCHQVKQLKHTIDQYAGLKQQPFINEREKTYLSKTFQFPVTNKPIRAGELISLSADVDYKRSNVAGMNMDELKSLLADKYVIAAPLPANTVLQTSHFKKAVIATIIAGRLKSSRLKRKALLPIGDLSSVEFCIKSCLGFPDINYTILATSSLPEDAELSAYRYRDDVIFHTGDPEDVIQRYLDICEKLSIDVIVRVTADCPFISKEIVTALLDAHFKSGADFTYASNAAVGTSADIINTSALRTIKEHFPRADYSEYMSWYFKNNPDCFKIKEVILPENLSRNYRLTLDHQEDLDMFNAVIKELKTDEFSTAQLFEMLDNNPAITAINSGITLKYQTDQVLIDTLNKATRIQAR